MFRLLTLLAFVSGAVWADSVDGFWKGSMPGRDGARRDIEFQFQAKGKELTGSMQGAMGRQNTIRDGELDGDRIQFTIRQQFTREASTLHYSGRLVGDELRMKMKREGSPRSVEFTLRKQ